MRKEWKLVWREVRLIDKRTTGGAFSALSHLEGKLENSDDEEELNTLPKETQFAVLRIAEILRGRELYSFLPARGDCLAKNFRIAVAKRNGLDGDNPYMSPFLAGEATRQWIAWGDRTALTSAVGHRKKWVQAHTFSYV